MPIAAEEETNHRDLDKNDNHKNVINISAQEQNVESLQEGVEPLGKHSSEKSLLAYKSCFFTVLGAQAVLNSFLPLYLKQHGLNPAQIGSVMFFKPIGGLLGGASISHLRKIFRNQITLLYIVCWFYLVCGLSISLLPNSPLAERCPFENQNRLTNHTHINYTRFNAELGVRDRSWLFDTSNQWFLVLCLCVLVFFVDFFFVVVDTLLHSITITGLGKDNIRSYGVVRAWGALGHGTSSLLTGLVIFSTLSTSKICGTELKLADYHQMFYVYTTIAWIILLNIGCINKGNDPETQEDKRFQPSDNSIRKIILNFRIISWVVVLLCRSMFYAVTQGILNWHLENIGASPILIGSCTFVTTTTEFLAFYITPYLIERFGELVLASIGITSYVLRFYLFSIITNPFYIIPVEILEGTMYAFLWSSMVTFLSSQVNEKEQTKFQGLLQATVMLGTGFGLIISGQLTQIFGAQVMFSIFSVFSAVTSIAFISVQLKTSVSNP